MMVWLLLACSATTRPPSVSPPVAVATLLQGGIVVGQGAVDVRFRDGRIVEIGPALELGDDERVDVGGRFLVPAFIDSHVHLAYLAEGESMADGGVAGAVDLASPLDFLALDHAPLQVLASGPMVTAVGGYPTWTWGSDGYGLECADAEASVAAVDRLHTAGARVIKLPVTSDPQLDDDALSAAVERAHALGLRVASHALEEDAVVRAAAAGVDVLAHTPVAALGSGSTAAWSGRAVVGTLSALGGSSTALANLASLRDAGATVLYGTDFGNTRTAGIDPHEVALMSAAGLSGAEILASGTSVPAAFWGFPDLGVIEVGRAASVLVLSADPTLYPDALSTPETVWISGVRRP